MRVTCTEISFLKPFLIKATINMEPPRATRSSTARSAMTLVKCQAEWVMSVQYQPLAENVAFRLFLQTAPQLRHLRPTNSDVGRTLGIDEHSRQYRDASSRR